jgi:hypothetical protein
MQAWKNLLKEGVAKKGAVYPIKMIILGFGCKV